MAEWAKDNQYLIYKDFNIPLTLVSDLGTSKKTMLSNLQFLTKGKTFNVPISTLVINNQCDLVRKRFEIFKYSSLVDFEKMLNLFYNETMYGKLSSEMLSIIRNIYLDSRKQLTNGMSKNFDNKILYLLEHSVPDAHENVELQLNELPNKLTLWRGSNSIKKIGLSWTTDKNIAKLFAHDYDDSFLMSQEFNRKQILSIYKDDNNEHEVLVNPKYINRNLPNLV
jgi:hypothetical protein